MQVIHRDHLAAEPVMEQVCHGGDPPQLAGGVHHVERQALDRLHRQLDRRPLFFSGGAEGDAVVGNAGFAGQDVLGDLVPALLDRDQAEGDAAVGEVAAELLE